LSILHL